MQLQFVRVQRRNAFLRPCSDGKKRLKDEGNETVTNCHGLKMSTPDGGI